MITEQERPVAAVSPQRPLLRVLQVHNRYRSAWGEDLVADSEAALLGGAGHRVTRWIGQNPLGSAAAAGSLLLAPRRPPRAPWCAACAPTSRPFIVGDGRALYERLDSPAASLSALLDACETLRHGAARR